LSQTVRLKNKIPLKIYEIKDELEIEHPSNFGNYVTYKTATKKLLLESVEGLVEEDILKEIKPVKNAVIFIKDNILYCKHYDTIILAFDLVEFEVLELYGNCSQTSERQLYQIVRWLKQQNFIEFENFGHYDFLHKNATKSEPTIRGMKNKFWNSEYGGGY